MSDWLWIHHRKLLAAAAAVVALVVLSLRGCEGAAETELSGTVTTAGKKVTWGTVTVVASDNLVYTAPIRPDGTYRFERLPSGPVRGMGVTSPNPHDHVAQNPATVGLTAAGVPVAGRGGRVSVSGGGGSAGGAGGGAVAVARGGRPGGSSGGGGSRSEKKQVYGMDATVAQPSITTPASAPPQVQWVPVPGKYGNPLTSGLVPPAAQGPTQFNITLD